MDYLPLYFKLHGQHCLIVGGGVRAERKASLFLRAGATVHVVATDALPSLKALLSAPHVLHARAFEADDISKKDWVFAATENRDLDESIARQARAAGIPVAVVERPELSDFSIPAIVDRSPMVMSISSGTQSPILTRLLRGKLESAIPASYGLLAQMIGETQSDVKRLLSDTVIRRRFWEQTLDGPLAEMAFAGQYDEAKAKILEQAQHWQQEVASQNASVGEVYLIGAGPGDPDLLTFKALRLMQQADVILYDRLVSTQIMDLCRRDAERIYVGKARSEHTLQQSEINQRLIDLAKNGRRVARIKGGDPFIFGRGGEEIEGLMAEGIPFQVVPGVTAAAGCAAYSGIPLTHRDHAQSVRFVTGHLQEGAPDLKWQELVQERQTVVFYMGLAGLETITKNLIAHGMDKDMPMAMVQQGTTSNHKTLIATVSTMSETVRKQQIKAPTLLIMGTVVSLHQQLNWFDPKSAVAEFNL